MVCRNRFSRAPDNIWFCMTATIHWTRTKEYSKCSYCSLWLLGSSVQILKKKGSCTLTSGTTIITCSVRLHDIAHMFRRVCLGAPLSQLVQFKMVSRHLGKPIYALHRVSQRLPQCCLLNGSSRRTKIQG